MSTPPRRRRPDARREKPDGGGWLPTILMGLGVIVAGLGIGVLVAVLTQRTSEKPVALKPVAVATDTPGPSMASAAPTARPIVIATLVPPRTARPSPMVLPSPGRSAVSTAISSPSEPSVAPSSALVAAQTVAPPQPSPTALAIQDSVPTAKPQHGAAVTSTPLVSPSASPAQTASPALTPIAPPTGAASSGSVSPTAASPVAAPSAAAPAAPAAAGSAYDEHASAVVRRYVDALIRGDEKTAYGALGSGGGTLSEQAFLDPGARIVSLKVTRIDASNASVGCEIAAAKGHYYATYHVTAANGGPYISQHDYIKV